MTHSACHVRTELVKCVGGALLGRCASEPGSDARIAAPAHSGHTVAMVQPPHGSKVQIRPERHFGGGMFSEIGRPGLIFDSGDGRLAITGSFDLLYWPGRAVYYGHRLRYRLSLYETRTRRRIAALDAARYPINAVAFHPSEPLIALGTGSYDGGYSFEGELLLWSYQTGEVRSVLGESREVAGCRFLPDGRLSILLRPRYEDEFEVGDAFSTFVTCVLDPREALSNSTEGDPRLAGLLPADPRASGFEVGVSSSPADSVPQFASLAASWSGAFEERHHVWDVAWLDDDSLLIALDGCLAESWTGDGVRRARHVGRDQGVQIFPGNPAVVHAIQRSGKSWSRSVLWVHAPELREIQRFTGCLVFSRTADGSFLGRGTTPGGQSRPADVIVTRDGYVSRSLELGGYDCFNHYLRVDGGAQFLYLAGERSAEHTSKRLMTVSSDGNKVQRLWMWDRADTHRMESTACIEADERIVAGYRLYRPQPGEGYAFLESRALADGRTLWSVPVDSAVTALAVAPRHSCVIFALLSGRVGALAFESGALLWEDVATIDELPTIVTALAVRDDRIAAGTICGRTMILRISDG
jgi:hypothetical protein